MKKKWGGATIVDPTVEIFYHTSLLQAGYF